MMELAGFMSINFAGNMGVIKTRPGYASALAWNIDRGNIPQILGTIAGDDTIFIAMREGYSPEEVLKALDEAIGPPLSKEMSMKLR
jgi:transcriptional regulator of arginine metabolism